MEVQNAVDLVREAIWLALVLGAPMLLAALAVGLIVSLLQAVTQVQEQTLSFLPKLVAILVVGAACLPWMLTRMADYFQTLVAGIPEML
jgi:flagellar biosynthetic protein FliQ